MKEKGWIYCSGIISDCPPGTLFVGGELYGCRHQTKESHWHKVFETKFDVPNEAEKSFIDWDVMYEEVLGIPILKEAL